MALISATGLAKSYGPDDIFEEVSVSIPHGARIALVGPNGSGKTTLLRLLARYDEPSAGEVIHARNLRIGFLPQLVDAELSGSASLWDEMVRVFEGLLNQEQRLHQMAEELAANPSDEGLLARYGEAQERFEQAGGYEYPILIQQVLGGLGFDEEDFHRPVGQLSGGQKTRAVLARLLLESPDLLILDEPTNHLDIRAIEWLEGWLRDFKGALLIVSHDRYFMDRVVTVVWELIFGRLEEYRGSYSHYLQQREERHARLLEEFRRQQEFIEKEQDYIRRNIAGQNTRQAQGRRKRLERFLRDEAIVRPREHRLMRLRLEARRRSGDKVLMTRKLVVGYHDDGKPLFEVPDITLVRGECAALIGPNGTGKTTFMKTIIGQLPPLAGEAMLGASVEIGYFAQAHEELNPTHTVLEEVLAVKDMPISAARSYLASFLFTGDDVYKPIPALSGGERGRVALAKLALRGANLLLLDEPTNHLDIPSQEILEAVLADFEGTILLISHDRYLIRSLATQIWELQTPRRGQDGETRLIVYEGPYEEYLAWREAQAAAAPPRGQARGEVRRDAAARPRPSERKSGISPRERERLIQQIEARIHQTEINLVNLSGAIEQASAAGDVEQVSRLGRDYSRAEAELAELMARWESLLAGEEL
ncbi:MAG: ABC-F family ATP-binding cassette domain-containing protein [Anaerolineae bacterium]